MAIRNVYKYRYCLRTLYLYAGQKKKTVKN